MKIQENWTKLILINVIYLLSFKSKKFFVENFNLSQNLTYKVVYMTCLYINMIDTIVATFY